MTVDCFVERLCRTFEIPKALIVASAEDNRHSVRVPSGRSITIEDIRQFAVDFYGRYQLQVGLYDCIPATPASCGLEVRNENNLLYRVIRVVVGDIVDIKIDAIN